VAERVANRPIGTLALRPTNVRAIWRVEKSTEFKVRGDSDELKGPIVRTMLPFI